MWNMNCTGLSSLHYRFFEPCIHYFPKYQCTVIFFRIQISPNAVSRFRSTLASRISYLSQSLESLEQRLFQFLIRNLVPLVSRSVRGGNHDGHLLSIDSKGAEPETGKAPLFSHIAHNPQLYKTEEKQTRRATNIIHITNQSRGYKEINPKGKDNEREERKAMRDTVWHGVRRPITEWGYKKIYKDIEQL